MMKIFVATLALVLGICCCMGTYALADVAVDYNPIFSWPVLFLVVVVVVILLATIYNKRKKDRNDDE